MYINILESIEILKSKFYDNTATANGGALYSLS